MTAQAEHAIVAILAMLVVCYAYRLGHLHYMPDLLALAIAFNAPRQELAIGAVLVLAIVRHSWLAAGLAEWVPDWLLSIVLPGACDMSSVSEPEPEPEPEPKAAISSEENTAEIAEIGRPVAEMYAEKIAFGETIALARLVAANKIGLTDAVKIGAAAKSGDKYSRRSREVKAEVERLKNHYPTNTGLKRFGE